MSDLHEPLVIPVSTEPSGWTCLRKPFEDFDNHMFSLKQIVENKRTDEQQ